MTSKMTKSDWLYRLRRCSSIETLEAIIDKNRYALTTDELESFNSASDHRLAELTIGRLFDKVPPEAWKLVF